MSFYLYSAGMFDESKSLEEYSEVDKLEAKNRYLNALSAVVRGSAMLVLKRKDICINEYNPKIMKLYKANQFAVAQQKLSIYPHCIPILEMDF